MHQFPWEGLTFDDVTLLTQYADFLPADAVISSRLTSRITVNMPFVSAAMDTVTEAPMAIAMAMQGGIGVIHKNLSPEKQAKQVGMVKHHLHGLIRDPIVFKRGDTLERVRLRKAEKGFSFSGFPIVDDSGRLVGILSATDLRYSRKPPTASVSEVMTSRVITAPPDTSLEQSYEIMMQNKIGKLPLVDKEGKLVGLYSFSDVKSLVENEQPQCNRDSKYRLRVAAAVSAGDHQRSEALAAEGVDVICVDSAHGDSKGIIEMVRWLKKRFAEIDVVAGNVATAEGALHLRDAGADAVKVGIGPGSICTTRIVCGVGIPQVSAVYQCAKVLEGTVPVIADGGIRHSGDVPKAIVAGADTVMLGSVLARTDESPGEKIIHEGRQYVIYRGMGSVAAMKEAAGSRERYMQGDVSEDKLVPQGIEGIVPHSGSVEKVMTQFCGGLRSAMGYCGCRTIQELRERGKLFRVSMAGLHESHPHDVKITREAPNYRS
ncbi:MAG: IMP dehydrogenase [Lentisphaerae bacterium]|nr:IMP dehydrogenase [Lentisphaerota bacterium]